MAVHHCNHIVVEHSIICYFGDHLKTANVEIAAIKPVCDGNAVLRIDNMAEDECHCHKEELENYMC